MDWPLGVFFVGFNNFNGGFGFGKSGTSKADSRKQGGSTSSSPYDMSLSEDRHANKLFGQVSKVQWSIPEFPSPPTASGTQWQWHPGSYGDSNSSALVLDISSLDNSLSHCIPAD